MFALSWRPSFWSFAGKWFSEHINSGLSTLSRGSSRQEVCDTGSHCSQTWPMAMWVTRTSDCLFVCLSACWATISNHGSICFHSTDIEVKVTWFGKLFETLVCDICTSYTIIVFLTANPVMLLYMHRCSLFSSFTAGPNWSQFWQWCVSVCKCLHCSRGAHVSAYFSGQCNINMHTCFIACKIDALHVWYHINSLVLLFWLGSSHSVEEYSSVWHVIIPR